MAEYFVLEYIRLLQRVADHCFRCLLNYVSSEPAKPNCGLCFNFSEQAMFTVSYRKRSFYTRIRSG